MDARPHRRRPRPHPVEGAPEPEGARGRAPVDPFRVIVGLGTLAIVAVVAVAFATGTADELPWGAIIGVLVIVAAAAVTSRRRARRIRESFPDEDA